MADSKKILVACEFSGEVRRALRTLGHDAYSCDLEPAEDGSEFHIVGDALEAVKAWLGWDAVIAFPPCTHLCSSGARWWKDKAEQQREAIEFAVSLWNCNDCVAIENPIGILSRFIGKPSQIIQPWQFGHGETKATCLWLKGLPLLAASNVVDGRIPRVHRMSPSKFRSRERSRTYQGIAQAMALQWFGDATQGGL